MSRFLLLSPIISGIRGTQNTTGFFHLSYYSMTEDFPARGFSLVPWLPASVENDVLFRMLTAKDIPLQKWNGGHEMKTNTCPKCGHTYQGYPALSRVDNRTKICPDCGIREAMEDAGIGSWTRREIMTRMITVSSHTQTSD